MSIITIWILRQTGVPTKFPLYEGIHSKRIGEKEMKKKKLIVLLTAFSMVFGLAACGDNASVEVDDGQKTVEEEADSNTSDVTTDTENYGEITEELVRNHKVTSVSDFEYGPEGSDGIRISKYLGTDTIVVIPEEIDGKKVVAVSNIFWNDSSVQGVLIPSTVKEIGALFANNKNIEVVIAEGLEVLGQAALGNCDKLHTVIFDESLKEIETAAIMFEPALKELYIPESVETIPPYELTDLTDCTIKGKSGSYIETHCSEYGIKFEAVD